MPIEKMGTMNELLRGYNSKGWIENIEYDKSKFSDIDSMLSNTSPINENKMSFADLLANSIGKVNEMQHDADKAVQRLASGESKNIHETMLAVERADIAFKAMNQIRMKVIDAYKEVMRMQV